jgi:hypothetical protein
MSREEATVGDYRYKFRVITKSETHTRQGMGVVVAVTLLAGEPGRLSMCGTFSMTEAEWLPLKAALVEGLGGDVEFEDLDRAGRPV